VTGIDLAPGLIETARRLAAEEGLDVRFEVGDAEDLPHEAAAFDAVVSSMAFIFALDHAAAAGELARVCRPGGRIALAAWRPETSFTPVTRAYRPPLPAGAGDSDDWGREDYAQERLGHAFELRFEEGDAPVTGESGEAVFQLMLANVGPFKATHQSLEPDRREAFRREFVEYLEAHRHDGGIRLPAEYLVIVGRRR
jgi:SAM-dependent methyltransferase